MYNDEIRALAEQEEAYALELRRHFHRHPELSFQERETAARVAKELEAMGIAPQVGYGADTNVVGVIQGQPGGRTVLLRADMDALPIAENADSPYCSRNPGVMHACAHDGHTAGLLGTARILMAMRDKFRGTVKLAFECGEEDGGGAQAMIDKGILQDPPVEAAFGCHLFGTVAEGRAAFRAGNFMASCDTVRMVIKGLGGHASTPHLAIDPVVIAAQVITAAQAVVARTISPTDIGVMTFSTIHGGEFFNIIPDQVEITGSIRNFSPTVRQRIHQVLEGLLRGICGAYGATYEIGYTNSLPAVVNDPGLVEKAAASMAAVLGADKIDRLEQPQMGGETFSYFCRAVPSCFFFLGIDAGERLPKGANLHHNALFCWNDAMLKTYMQGLAQIAVDYLTN